MQGLESLNQFQNFVSSIGGLGRFEDTYMVHAAEGETVVPMEVLDQNPLLKKRLFKSMKALGIDPGRYIVGNDLNSLNPVTGHPEFFLKRIKKALGDIAGYAAPIVGAMYGPGWGAATGAALGAFKRENPGDPSQWAQMAGLGGLSGLAANVAGGHPMFRGQGLSTGLANRSPLGMFEHYLDPKSGKTPWKDYFTKPSGEYESSILEKTFGGTNKEVVQKTLETELANLEANPIYAGMSKDKLYDIAVENTAKKTGVPMKEIVGWGLGLGLLEKFTTGDQT